jgi:uncharacterized membrane protein
MFVLVLILISLQFFCEQVARQRQQTNLKTVVKMFFVMGLTWIAEIVSFVLVASQFYFNHIPFLD